MSSAVGRELSERIWIGGYANGSASEETKLLYPVVKLLREIGHSILFAYDLGELMNAKANIFVSRLTNSEKKELDESILYIAELAVMNKLKANLTKFSETIYEDMLKKDRSYYSNYGINEYVLKDKMGKFIQRYRDLKISTITY